jgi:hypothetical protein
VESLIHGLIGARHLSVEGAVAIVEIALDAQIAMADADQSLTAATVLLESLLSSLEIDLP